MYYLMTNYIIYEIIILIIMKCIYKGTLTIESLESQIILKSLRLIRPKQDTSSQNWLWSPI
jgi:hypothetical protein